MLNTYINKIEIEGIGVYNNRTVFDIKTPLHIITGKKNSGKSSIIKALLWSIFDKEFDYLETYKEHSAMSVTTSIHFDNNNFIINKTKKDKNIIIKDDKNKEKLENFENYINYLKKLIHIININPNVEIGKKTHYKYIQQIFKDISIQNEIEKLKKEYEEQTQKEFDRDLYIEKEEKIKNLKDEITKLQKTINEVNEIIERKNKLTKELNEIENSEEVTPEKIKNIKEEFLNLEKKLQLYKTLLKFKLVDYKEIINLDKKSEYIEHELKVKIENIFELIKKQFQKELKDFYSDFSTLYYNQEEYIDTQKLLSIIEQYQINNDQIKTFKKHIDYIENELTYIIKNKNNSDFEDKLAEILKNDKNNNNSVLIDYIKIFKNRYKDAKEFIILLNNIEKNETIKSMCKYYKTDDYQKLMKYNNKAPFFIVYQIFEKLKTQFNNKINKSLKFGFNEQIKKEIEDLLINYFKEIKKIRSAFLSDEDIKIYEENKKIFEATENDLNDLIIKTANIIEEYKDMNKKLKYLENRNRTINSIKEKLKEIEKIIQQIAYEYKIRNTENILNELEEIYVTKNNLINKINEEYTHYIELKENTTQQINKKIENFNKELNNLNNNAEEIINKFIKEYSNKYEIIFDNEKEQIFFNNGEELLPIQITEKLNKILYIVALARYANSYFKLINTNIILFYDNLYDTFTETEFESLMEYIEKINDMQQIITKRENI